MDDVAKLADATTNIAPNWVFVIVESDPVASK
jgi:hypothetical protein